MNTKARKTAPRNEIYEILIGERGDGIGYAHVLDGTPDHFPTLAWSEGEHHGWRKGFFAGLAGGIVLAALVGSTLIWICRWTR